VTTSPSPTRRRSLRFCLALPRWAIGAMSFVESIYVALCEYSHNATYADPRVMPQETAEALVNHDGSRPLVGITRLIRSRR
jgi:hypothetical protein